MKGYWTQRQLATIVGLEMLGESIEEIALITDRHPDDVRDGLRKAKLLMSGDASASDEGSEAYRSEKRIEQDIVDRKAGGMRKFRIARHLLPQPGESPPDLTAELMGDPSAAAARRSTLSPPPWRAEPGQKASHKSDGDTANDY